ncbi:MAG: copper-binding protein [Synechococcaceae bacterium WB8_1B_136]|nr:copper-binding protein [Synechococcaceae bacterium WB8_1B_136]
MTNPFSVRWLAGWSFQTVFMEGQVQVEAHGFGICLRTPMQPGESPVAAADRLVLAEDQRRRALHNAWLQGQRLQPPAEAPELSGAVAESDLLPLEPPSQPLIRLLSA